jgi:hypothetical protein
MLVLRPVCLLAACLSDFFRLWAQNYSCISRNCLGFTADWEEI